MRFSVILSVFLIAFSGSVLAGDAIQLDVTKENFREQQTAILKAVNTDVEYSEISIKDRSDLTAALTRIGAKLVEVPFHALNEQDRQYVLNDQKSINAGLLQAKSDSRLVCRRETVIGSNFAKKVCRTAASLKKENDKLRDEEVTGNKKP